MRRFVARVGKDSIDALFDLRRADQAAMGRGETDLRALIRLHERIEEVLQRDRIFSVKDLAVDGRDVMRHIGLNPGPEIGVILDFLLEAVLDDPSQNTREMLLEMSSKFYHQRVKRP